ncbi:MAG: VWA domain-containing protein [Pseudomonadota bacterium]
MGNPLAARLHGVIPEHELNSWERDDLLEQLSGYDRQREDVVLTQIGVLWPVSHSLCFAFLEQLDAGLACLDEKQLPEWVKGILAAYESDGLRAARAYMEDVELNFLCRLRGENGLTLVEAQGKLLHYVRGLAGKNLQIEPAAFVATDTETIFLPREITIFQDKTDNFRVFKLLASFQWAFIHQDLYCHRRSTRAALAGSGKNVVPTDQQADLLDFFLRQFPVPELARDIYHLLQSVRASFFLKSYLPALMRDAQPFFVQQLQEMSSSPLPAGAAASLHEVRLWLLAALGGTKSALPVGAPGRIIEELQSAISDMAEVFSLTAELYHVLRPESEDYTPLSPLLFQGELKPQAANRARLVRRAAQKQKFIDGLAAILPLETGEKEQARDEVPEKRQPAANVLDSGANVAPMQSQSGKEEDLENQDAGEPRFICLDDEKLDLPEELKSLAREIEDDLGGIPAFYIASAGMKAGSRGKNPMTSAEQEDGNGLSGELLYDEWDYRRQGFRKDWCHLIRKNIHPVKGTFVGNTLATYRGQIIQLKRQFEMMQTRHRFVKRQRDGDEIDVDALIEAYADVKAGHAPSERLFVRLLRDERDIAALFLVDMSSSTEGWVGTALKESLVLLSEAMEALGDRYAIYGFSGMRRTRCEVYHVKDFAEPYSDEIKGRIAAIAPIDYTRMGPPIRHFTAELARLDAKVRLLIILTDGKPEDYDDYKGEYAIEDTRHALIEAKVAGIHPFCITIDREAQDYMAHMFGKINYTFIDDVRKLPLRVPEIYRTITS